MITQLAVRRGHLNQHRRMLVGRSLLAAALGALPIPVVEERVVSAVLCSTLRKVARGHQVDVSHEALAHIAHGQSKPPKLDELLSATVALRTAARTFRRLMALYMTARRAQAASRYFLVGTLFDHYCATLHVGVGIDAPRGQALRKAIEEAIAQTPDGLGWLLFRRGAVAAARATARAPGELMDIVTRGAFRRLLAKRAASGDDAATPEEPAEIIEGIAGEGIDSAVDQLGHELGEQSPFLTRAATVIENQLSVSENPYLDHLVDNFERLWRERTA